MKKFKYLVIALLLLMLYPVINGMGCDFNYKYVTSSHEQFGSCKFGQYTLIDYPDPKQDNGYTVLKGLYFYAFGMQLSSWSIPKITLKKSLMLLLKVSIGPMNVSGINLISNA